MLPGTCVPCLLANRPGPSRHPPCHHQLPNGWGICSRHWCSQSHEEESGPLARQHRHCGLCGRLDRRPGTHSLHSESGTHCCAVGEWTVCCLMPAACCVAEPSCGRGWLRSFSFCCPPQVSKYAVRGMTAQVAAELGEFGIRVNCVAPGPVDTVSDLSSLAQRSPQVLAPA